jgi:Flp pilus assembly protein TadD
MTQLAIALRHHKAGRLVEAEAIALALKPNDATMHVDLGSSLRDLGKTKDAVAHYARALQLNPNFAEAHHNLGTALLDQRRHERCRAANRAGSTRSPPSGSRANCSITRSISAAL